MRRGLRFCVCAIAMGGLLGGCFLSVTSGVVRGVPVGAQAAATGLLATAADGAAETTEVVRYSWDGSFHQDGSLLVLLTDRRLWRRDATGDVHIELIDVQQIVVDEDEGHVRVKTAGALMLLPLSTSSERLTFARHLQEAVQASKIRASTGGDADTGPEQ